MPSADEIKKLLFPAVTSAEVTDEGLRVVVREAFPSLGGQAQWGMIPAIMSSAAGRASAIGRPPGVPPGANPGPSRKPSEPEKGASPGAGASSSSRSN